MSWCDKLAATPGVGFKLDPHYIASDTIVNALTPWLDKWASELKPSDRALDKLPLNITRQESFAFGFNLDEGTQFGIEPAKLFVEFTHRIRIKTVSGGPPVAEMLSEPLPYTALLPRLAQKLVELTLMLPSPPDRTLTRIGVIAVAHIEPDIAPPGIKRFLEYVGKPWKGLIDGYTFQITGVIDESVAHSERCLHNVTKTEGSELLTLKFDWQRTFKTGVPLTESTLKTSVVSAQKSALDYFEDLAEGNRFDAELI